MADASEPLTTRPVRYDGWTPERRRRFLGLLGAGIDVRRACAGVGLSRQAAYTLRRRDPEFARAWDEALRSARAADEAVFVAMLPERLLRTMSELSGECHFGDRMVPSGPCQSCQGRVNFGTGSASRLGTVGKTI